MICIFDIEGYFTIERINGYMPDSVVINFRSVATVTLIIAVIFVASSSVLAGQDNWKRLDDGLELLQGQVVKESPVGDSIITILRIDPAIWKLELFSTDSAKGSRNLTARQWCRKKNLVAAINAGMYHQDHRTHVGYMKSSGRVVSPKVNQYQSVALFNPNSDSLAPFRILDLDRDTLAHVVDHYRDVVQNLRLIKHRGENRWSPKGEKWSEAALGEDEKGRILFIFCRSSYAMHDLNEILLSLPMGLMAAQHLEGGPEAQLYLHHGATEIDLFGSYKTGFFLNDGNFSAWPIPNIIGISKRIK
jgi:hypothetical protein